MSCCCSIDLGFPGALLDRFTIGPDMGPARPIPGCPGRSAGLPADLGMPQSPGPAIGGRWAIPIPLPMAPGRQGGGESREWRGKTQPPLNRNHAVDVTCWVASRWTHGHASWESVGNRPAANGSFHVLLFDQRGTGDVPPDCQTSSSFSNGLSVHGQGSLIGTPLARGHGASVAL